MTAAAAPRQIVEQIRKERGSIVDTAIEMGRIVIVENKGSENVNRNHNQN